MNHRDLVLRVATALVMVQLSVNSMSQSISTGSPVAGNAFPDIDKPAEASEQWSSIVNGTVTSLYPSVGALLRKLPNGEAADQGHCSATLVGCSFLLTAAHCISGKDPETYLAWFQSAGAIKVKSVERRHPLFKECSGDSICSVADIALVELAEPVNGIRTSPITRTTEVPLGDSGTIVGFGISRGGRQDFGIKRRGSVKAATCTTAIGGAMDDAWLCWEYSSRASSNTCSGDSGGPLFASNQALGGVTSTGMKANCSLGDRAFDTRISKYKDWIIQQAPSEISSRVCGPGAQAGERDAPMVMVVNDSYRPDGHTISHRIKVPANTKRLTLSLQAVGIDFRNIAELKIEAKRASEALATPQLCKGAATMNFSTCVIESPAQGDWDALVSVRAKNITTESAFVYQVVATMFMRQ